MMRGADALARQLYREGVRVLFGLPGDQLMAALDALYDIPEIRYITTRHEQGTTYLADGYARAGGQPGVSMVVPGIGVYNAATGLATAYATSSPVFQIAGQVARSAIDRDLEGLHDINGQLDIVRPITKWAELVLDPAAIPAAVREAFRQMATGRPRPVHVEIPPETLIDEADITLLDPEPVEPSAGDPEHIAAAATLLAGAARPLIVAGGGAMLGGASAALTAIAELLQAPVITTREGKGAIDDRHPLSVGTMWVNRRLRPVIDDADVILAVGTRFQGFATAPNQQIVHLDADPTQIAKHAKVAVGIVAHAGAGSEALLVALDSLGAGAGAGARRRPSRTAETMAMRASVGEQLRAIGPAAHMVESLRRAIPDDAVVVPCTTTIGYMCHMHFPVYEPRTYLASSYMGTLGFAFPTAIGAKVAVPERPVVAISGDGGFLFAATELATAVQYGINTVTVIFNDNAYGNSNRDQREKYQGRELGTALRNPDFAAFARSFGARGETVTGIDELEPLLREAIADAAAPGGLPTVIEVPMDRLPSPF